MDFEKIRELRSRVSIPLDVAVRLLEKNDGDVLKSEQDFHANNIVDIKHATECDLAVAKENYFLWDQDKTKTIDKIRSKQVTFTTIENHKPRNEIGFILWPETTAGENYKTITRNDVFIPSADFEFIIELFESVFPVRNPRSKRIDQHFDPCGHNYFDKETCETLILKIQTLETEESKVEVFLADVIDWLKNTSEFADYIVVYGNL